MSRLVLISSSWYVEEQNNDKTWSRSAVGFIWSTKQDANKQMKDLKNRYPDNSYRLAERTND
jgi:hypothetical protein